ncbi:MAG: prephenate dehydratase [Sediminibacterium sp.]|nr:prephenate dehydratase [Sediminibacterium sp.]
MEKKICIQGYEGSFHHVAAQKYFNKNCTVFPCLTFRELINNTQNNDNFIGLMAIENSIAGSILPNYNLLLHSNLQIIGEIYLTINQNLLVNKGVKLSQIKEVQSHYMAILQCMDFLQKHHWKLIETEDTALSAKLISQHKNMHAAAIGSSLAASLFNLDIITPKIQTTKKNFTRFLILDKLSNISNLPFFNKISIYFETNHAQGILAKILQIINKKGYNLSKLQSMPIIGSRFRYGFYIDIESDNTHNFNTLYKKLEENTQFIKILGKYINDKNK